MIRLLFLGLVCLSGEVLSRPEPYNQMREQRPQYSSHRNYAGATSDLEFGMPAPSIGMPAPSTITMFPTHQIPRHNIVGREWPENKNHQQSLSRVPEWLMGELAAEMEKRRRRNAEMLRRESYIREARTRI
jgi:hypothetical protein